MALLLLATFKVKNLLMLQAHLPTCRVDPIVLVAYAGNRPTVNLEPTTVFGDIAL